MKKKKKINLFLLRNGKNYPSNNYRIYQHLMHIENSVVLNLVPNFIQLVLNNVKLNYLKIFIKTILYLYINFYYFLILIYIQLIKKRINILFIQREIIPRKTTWLLFTLQSFVFSDIKIYWDIDDNILESREIGIKDFKFFSRISSKIIIASEYLSEIIDPLYKDKILVIYGYYNNKTSTKSIINSIKYKINSPSMNFIWIGLPHNFISNFDRINSFFEQLNSSNFRLYILSNLNQIYFLKKNSLKNYKFIKWSEKNVKKFSLKSHFGIMPLSNSNFSKFKGSFKIIQYMSFGIIPIATRLGLNNNFVQNEKLSFENFDPVYFRQLYSDKKKLSNLMKSNFEIFNKLFSTREYAKMYKNLFNLKQ
jgi:hypothetical protein